MKLLLLFIVINIINVILQTTKTIMTVKSSKMGAAFMNAVSYGFYTIVIVYMVSDLNLIAKCLVVGGCNLVGVYIVKLVEEKKQKDKLWKIEATVLTEAAKEIDVILDEIPHNYMVISPKHTTFNCYCATKEESKVVKKILDDYSAKYFVAESKYLY